MGRVFQYDMPGQFCLQRRAIRLQLIDHASAIRGAESTHENVCALKVRGDIDGVNANQRSFEIDFTRNDAA
jgi:hypothetical protein